MLYHTNRREREREREIEEKEEKEKKRDILKVCIYLCLEGIGSGDKTRRLDIGTIGSIISGTMVALMVIPLVPLMVAAAVKGDPREGRAGVVRRTEYQNRRRTHKRGTRRVATARKRRPG